MPLRNVDEPSSVLASEHDSRDPLTGLAWIESLTGFIQDVPPPFTAIVLDLDALKIVNARYGYATGDFVLRNFALRLSRAGAPQGRAVRMEADRFALLLPGHPDRASALRFAEGLCVQLSHPLRKGEVEVSLSATAGVAWASSRAGTVNGLLADAERALARAKDQQKRVVLFGPADATEGNTPKLAAGELERAFRLGEWRLHYQPQVREPGRRLDGFEALLRWQHPERGLLAPGAFLDELRTHASAARIGRWVIDRACRDLATWRSQGLDVPRVAVNLFSDDVSRRSFRADVLRALGANGLAFADLELEVTEDIVVEPQDGFLSDLRSLRDLGVQIALDDFGTGFACLATLRDLPITSIKIDRSFVAGMGQNAANRAVVRAMLSIGRELGLRVVSEGVETGPQVVRLMNMGCRVFQGFRYSAALPAGEIATWAGRGRCALARSDDKLRLRKKL